MNNYQDGDSDVDIDEVARMVENLDDLDSDLLGGSVKKNSNPMKVKEHQKKVAFQDFDDDTSLDDLLSDGIDLGKTSKGILSEVKASKAADLFKITSNESKAPTISTFPEANSSRPLVKDLPQKRTYSERPKSTSDPPKSLEDFDANIPLSKVPDKGKKSSLMEDLFGAKSRASSLKDIAKSSMKKVDSMEMVSESMPNLLGKEQGGKSNPSGFSLSSSREPRRGRGKSTVLDDPLGLLTGPNIIEESPRIAKTLKIVEKKTQAADSKEDNLPEWLGGTKKSEKSVEVKPPPVLQETSPLQPELKAFNAPEVSQLTEIQLEQQASLLMLQQQQHELRTATVLSHQTEQLQNIIDRQKHQLNDQEKIFNDLVKKQVNRQATLDLEIKLQQAKIDHYIQALAKEPSIIPTHSSTSHVESSQFNLTNEIKIKEDVNLEYESLIHRLEVEKRNLENILEIMKEKHEREIKILEESHETQMHFMGSSMERLETKLRGNTETLERDYERKIEKLLNEKNQSEEFFREQINQLKEEHKEQINGIHERHSTQLSLLQQEHSDTIESISLAKQLETETIDFMQQNKTNLQALLSTSQELFQKYEVVSNTLTAQQLQLSEKKENYLLKQEDYLQSLKDKLNAQQELLENERKQLLLAADNLRTATSELSFQFQKNSELLNDTETRLKIREQSLIKEREQFQEQAKWERDNLQYLKDSWISEQKRQMQQLALERDTVAAEKAKLQVFSYLQTNSDDVSKAELEAAIKAAQEATQSAQIEKNKWKEQIEAYEADRHRIRMKEKNLIEKARELEELTQSAILKREEGMKSLKEAQKLEEQHRDRIAHLERQLEALAMRENKIATEKLALARDRLAVRVQPEKDISNYSFQGPHHPFSSQIQTHFKDVVDPQLLLLKLNLDDKLDTTNQLISDIQTIN